MTLASRSNRDHTGQTEPYNPKRQRGETNCMEPSPVPRHPKHLIHPRLWVYGVLLVIGSAANAQQSRITKPIDNTQRVTLTGHIHPKATPANDQGRVAPSLKLSYVTLTLTPSDAQKADLRNLLAEQQNPSSPNYRRWLTPQQYADRFGVSAEDMSKITQWLQGQGLSIVNVAQGRNWIAVSGSAAQIDTAFATEIHQYAVDGETHFANATNPSIPAAIGGMVLSIRGLNDFRMKARIQKTKYTSGSGNHYLGPIDLATIYDIAPAYNAGVSGAGQKIVVAGQSDVPVSDIQAFQSFFNLTPNLPQMVLVPGSQDPGISNGDREESDLDLEWSGAVARNATILFVYSEDVMTSVQYAIDQNLAPVISVSYGLCEQETGSSQALTFQSWAQQGNAQGITWFDASGDAGAADCNDAQNPGLAVDTPASVPEVTGVGGTAFVDGGGTYWSPSNTNGASALSYIPETSWNTSAQDGEPAASGGGVSIFFPKPSWQVGPGVPGNNVRNVPDIALNADPDNDGYIVFTDGDSVTPQVYGGTSCPTPVMAGIAALLNQYLGTGGLGNINPKLYSLAQSNPSVFHDITTGNNIVTAQVTCGRREVCSTPTPVGYNAGVGYDNVTGLGSVDAWKLLTCWSGTCAAGATPPPVVTPATSTLSLLSNLSTVGSQDYAFLTATATANDGVTTPEGVVVFSAGTAALGALTLVGSAGISTATLVVQGNELPAGSTTVTATYDGSSTSAPVTSSVTLNVRLVGTSSNGTPEISGLTDGAAFQQKYSPGMIMAVFGATLSPAGTAESASSVPLPVSMAGVAATVNGVEAPLFYVSPTQLNIQVPWQTPVNSPATLTIDNNGQIITRTFQTGPASPGIFADQTNTIVPNNGATPGQTTTLYMTGFGAVTPAVATGSTPAAGTPPAPQSVTVTVNGVPASTTCSAFCFVGIPSWAVGVLQINFEVPSGIPAGRQPVVVSVNGLSSVAAYINITN
jgi:uncharacterized protein (TIGR03437 family)